LLSVFFFQAEDGIRDRNVTGVQTCALPILALSVVLAVLSFAVFHITALGVVFVIAAVILLALLLWCAWIRRQYAFGGGGMMDRKIGRASCRGRVRVEVGGGDIKREREHENG